MNWEIGFSRDAEKFLKRENLRAEILAELINFLKRMKGESVSVSDAIRLHIEERLQAGESIDSPESISLTSLEVAV
jgi:hypothetical protein